MAWKQAGVILKSPSNRSLSEPLTASTELSSQSIRSAFVETCNKRQTAPVVYCFLVVMQVEYCMLVTRTPPLLNCLFPTSRMMECNHSPRDTCTFTASSNVQYWRCALVNRCCIACFQQRRGWNNHNGEHYRYLPALLLFKSGHASKKMLRVEAVAYFGWLNTDG